MPDLVPVSPADLQTAISYGLRFRRGKAHRRHSDLMAQLAAETLVELLEEAGYVVMQRPGGRSAAEAAGDAERARRG